MPFRDSDQSLPTGTSDSKSIGGPSLSVHYRIDLPLHPTLNAGISLPWRLSWKQVDGQPNASLPQDFSDSSSPTGGSIPFGATIHPQIGPFDFQLEATYTYFFPSDQEITDAPPGYPQATIKPGDKIKFTEEMSYPLTPNWKIGGGFEQTWGDNVQIDGVENLGTASRAVDTILGLDYRIDQQWNMGLKFTTPFPFEQFMVNQTFGSGVTLSVTLSDL